MCPHRLRSLLLPSVSRRSPFDSDPNTTNPTDSQPKKDKPKPATATKAAPASTRGGGRGRGRGRGRAGRDRGKKKTLEELDAEMEDYFPAAEGANDAMVTNGGAAGAAGGDTNMIDEMI